MPTPSTMTAPSTATLEEQMRDEIARLTASIKQAKSGQSFKSATRSGPRHNAYVNPAYKPPSNRYVRSNDSFTLVNQPHVSTQTSAIPAQDKEVVLGGVAFQSSARSLVRKDLSKTSSPQLHASVAKPRDSGHPYMKSRNPTSHPYKPKTTARARRGRNMTLNNTRSQQRARTNKAMKYSNKPCPRFSTTGVCTRGLTCPYQHDSGKIAICWNFLHGNCTNSDETCNLSHDPTPERTPLCLHFLNNGRCTRENCPFPHANLGARRGVCRDFAVLGYCENGLDCDKQHVRECPDFAEKGACSHKGCKLPHVIRANRNRKPAMVSSLASSMTTEPPPSINTGEGMPMPYTLANAQMGDEFISLTFNESESDEDENEDDSEEEGSDDDADDNDQDDKHSSDAEMS